MNREELLDRLQGYEWNDIEFKQAHKGVSQDAYKTVSAFACRASAAYPLWTPMPWPV